MAITELLKRNDQEQAAGEIGFAEWHTIKDALTLLREGRRDWGELEAEYTETEESCKGCMGPCGMCEDTESRKQSKSVILREMFGYTDRGMGVTPRWEWTVQGGAEAYMKALEDRVRQLEFEREEVRKMRTVQKKFFRSPQGSAAKVAALEESRRLERWVDTALEPEKPTAATLFG